MLVVRTGIAPVNEHLVATFHRAPVVRFLAIKADVIVLKVAVYLDSGTICNPDADLFCRIRRDVGVIDLADEVARPVPVGGGNTFESVVEPIKLEVLGGIEAHDGSLVLRVL